jgi:hypothetical protein
LLLEAVPSAPLPCATLVVCRFSIVHGAADPEAVEVAVAHVAERDPVERLPDLLRLEAADGDAVGPLVEAPNGSAPCTFTPGSRSMSLSPVVPAGTERRTSSLTSALTPRVAPCRWRW